MRVRYIMTQPPQTCRTDTPLVMASRRMRAMECGTLAVLDDHGRLAGILTDRDVALALGNTDRDAARVTAGEVMSRQVQTCGPEDDLHVALDRMASARVRRLPVIDAEGDLKGILSIDDIVVWGVGRNAVSMHQLADALRRICASHLAQSDLEMPRF